MQREKVAYFDLMRAVAAIAVVTIHVLGPYRHQLGMVADSEWLTAIVINSGSRWAVPMFIMISGALFLSDTRPFDGGYYLKRRVGKVLVPFLCWSLLYAGLSGVTMTGFDFAEVAGRIKALPYHETYYHLGFFYYFLPLYLVVPFLRYLCQNKATVIVPTMLLLWGVAVSANLLKIDGVWSHDMLFYSGYLLLGYWLYQSPSASWRTWAMVGGGVMMVTAVMVIMPSLALGQYTVGRWLSYKTINTALIAAAVFVVCQHGYAGLSASWKRRASELSRYSLGVYLLHPLVLWPVREFDLYWGPAWLVIPFWTIVAVLLSWQATRWLAGRPAIAWLVP